jgi:hypothetical protein
MSEKYKFRGPEGLYFVTMATVGWVDLFTLVVVGQKVIFSRSCWSLTNNWFTQNS